MGVLSPMEYKHFAGVTFDTVFKTSDNAKWTYTVSYTHLLISVNLVAGADDMRQLMQKNVLQLCRMTRYVCAQKDSCLLYTSSCV